MDFEAEEELESSHWLTQLADKVTLRRGLAAAVVFTVFLKLFEWIFGHFKVIEETVQFLWETADTLFVTAVAVASIMLWSIAKRAENLSRFAATLRARLQASAESAFKSFLHEQGKSLLTGTMAADAMEAFSLGAPGSERRYRMLIDHLRSLAAYPRPLDPAITYLIERNISQTYEDLRGLTNPETTFTLSGVEQVELSRRALVAAEHEVHFVDIEPKKDIEVAWSKPFLGYIGEVCADARIPVKRQTIVCDDARVVKDASARSEYLKKQIEYMGSRNFHVYLVARSVAPKVVAQMNWRFELYDQTAVRIQRQDKYEDDQDLDVTVLDAKGAGHVDTLLKYITGHAEEVRLNPL